MRDTRRPYTGCLSIYRYKTAPKRAARTALEARHTHAHATETTQPSTSAAPQPQRGQHTRAHPKTGLSAAIGPIAATYAPLAGCSVWNLSIYLSKHSARARKRIVLSLRAPSLRKHRLGLGTNRFACSSPASCSAASAASPAEASSRPSMAEIVSSTSSDCKCTRGIVGEGSRCG